MKKKIFLSEAELVSILKKLSKIREQSDDNGNNDFEPIDDEADDNYDTRENLIMELKRVVENDEELSTEIIDEIYAHGRPFRSGRGSIYIDVLVPETEDREFDRKIAIKMLEFYQSQISDRESYVGGAGFKTGNLLNPYDTMDF